MKKNYTLKITLAMLIVVLVSLVSFVGVYKGKSLVKEYSFGKDLSDRKIISLSVKEEQTNTEENQENNAEEEQNETTSEEENAEENENTEENQNSEESNSNNENSTEENKENNNNASVDKSKDYENAKNILEKRLADMRAEDFEIRLGDNGNVQIEIPSQMDTGYISELATKGKVTITNESTGETVIEGNKIKSASTRIDSTKYTKPIVLLNIKFSNDAKNTFKNINTKYTDGEGNESDATFALKVDGQTIYSDTADNFVSSAKNGSLELVYGQNNDTKEIENDYQTALVLVSILNSKELPVEYNVESVQIVKSNIDIKAIVIIACIIGAILLCYAIFKYKAKAILPVLSLVGLAATILLVIRYTNVKVTLFTFLGLAVIVMFNYVLILNALKEDGSFKQSFIEMLNVMIPCLIIAIVFCCSPYLQVASLGMTLFWGVVIMIIYNLIITRVLTSK